MWIQLSRQKMFWLYIQIIMSLLVTGGSMKLRILVLIACLGLALAGCSGNGAKELFETAQFEELQNNQEHARQLYEEIIKKYPQR
jgi:hypothetical protein